MLIFDVQRFCTHDGPGLRTVVFFKGCPMRCAWCQNPESISARGEIAFHANRCVRCFRCVEVCEHRALVEADDRLLRGLCQACGDCARACPQEALRRVGRRVMVDRLAEKLLADKAYFDASGGGITLSGGEPLMQYRAASRLLSRCKVKGVGTLVETCGEAPWEAFQALRRYTDQFYFDLKAGGARLHRELTGVGTERILDNASRLLEAGAAVRFRFPVVPGHNDSDESISALAVALKGLDQQELRLLRYNGAGAAKLEPLGSKQPTLDISADEAEEALARAATLFNMHGIQVTVEGEPTETLAAVRKEDPFTSRVYRLRKAVQRARPGICAERALLVTEYYRDKPNRKKPAIIQRAEALRHVLKSRSARIYDHELLVGSFSSRRVGGGILPELHGVAQLLDLNSFDTREVNPLEIDEEDRAALKRKVFPFWATRHLAARAFPFYKAPGFYRESLKATRYLINEAGGISHFVPDYELLLREGISGISRRAARAMDSARDQEQKDFHAAVQIVCKGVEEMAAAYEKEARRLARRERNAARMAELYAIAHICSRVPARSAHTMREALQSILLVQIALSQESLDNSISPGRLDQLLWPLYEADRASQRIERHEAAELIGCFTVKMSEIVPVFSGYLTRFHGGMFNGQVVVVGGQTPAGGDAENELTGLFLDAMERLRMRQPNYHARVHKGSRPAYVHRIAAMLRDGAGAPSLMNDDVVVPMLQGRRMTRRDALDYSPVGCVEPVSCGKTYGSTDAALANLAICLEWALGTRGGGTRTPPVKKLGSTEELFDAFEKQVAHLVAQLMKHLQPIELANARFHPTPLTSCLVDGCLEKGVDASAGGARYNASGIQGVGVVDVADSLAAVADVVFTSQLCDLPTLVTALKKDFEGYGWLQGHLMRAPKFGNDEPLVDRWADAVMGAFADALGKHKNTRGGPYVAGFYSVTSHQAFGETVGAMPSGRPAGAALANGLSPADGMDRAGPTAALNSAARLDLRRHAKNGVSVNVMLDPSAVPGEAGAEAVAALIRGYFANGGMHVQLNAVDPDLLRESREHPEKHPWLLVRVSGYSAYFADLSPEVQQEIIERTIHG